MLNNSEIRRILDVMEEMFPDAEGELVYNNPFELVIAVLLLARYIDLDVNKESMDLFAKYITLGDYLAVDFSELQHGIRSISLYRNKALNIQQLCQVLLDEHEGDVPQTS